MTWWLVAAIVRDGNMNPDPRLVVVVVAPSSGAETTIEGTANANCIAEKMEAE